MEKQIKKVLIVTNFNIYDKANAAIAVAEKLVGCGCEVCSPVYNKDKIIRMRGRAHFTFLPAEESYKSVDAIIVLGGDGTILESARRAAPFGVPVMGLNLGRLGYMAELEMSELDQIARIVSGDYKLEKRSMLNIELLNANGETRKNEYALNDAVLSNGTISRVVDLELYEGGSKIANYRADGMIIATPTGSTAYSLAAGGAIVDPRLACFCVTPICPHSLLSRPLVFPDSEELRVKNICAREKVLHLTVDGRATFDLFYGDSVIVTKSDIRAKLLRIKDEDFYSKIRMKKFL